MAKKKVEAKAPEKVEAKVEKAPERAVKCGNCGTLNEFGAITCKQCGYNRLNLVVREGNRVQEYH
jgi:ribosomal protein L40E